ncbi:deaminase domain-containing protein [Paenibacillus macerans]|uniref:deaminase domain-containing protein n=1 Tax=Paenibacillus macerans TaxID=44252 RepID=UPI002DB6BEF8|nr:deaminase domain-containing protein [Paenibacillus macerans]MEC0329136.1 deaminase domain-containing protein [Paenibacillus macerans]
MELKVDPARINGLADEVRRLEQQFGDQVTVTLKRVSELTRRTSSAYSEPGVRSAISEVERRMERIRQLSREIGGELCTKEKTLRWAAGEYTRQEQESFLKAKQLKLPVTLNPFAAFPTTSGNKTSVFPLPFSAFSLFSRAAVYLPITVEPLTKELTLDPEHYSDEVLKLQQRLQELGYELEANGYFDSATLKAINRYKEKYGLDNTGDRQGIVDENVWRTLFGTLSGLLTVQMHGQTYSEPLKMAQLRLQELGFEVEANGYFDEATVRALAGFREVYEKDQDGLEGVIGPVTWQALFNIPKVEQVKESKSEPQYYITSVDPRSYSLDDVLNRDDSEVQERLKQTYWADLTKEEQDRIYNELKELEKLEENEMRQKQSGIGNPFFANLMVGGSNAVVNAINTASAGLPELLAEWIMGPEPEGYVNPLDDPYGKGVGEAAGNVAGFFLPFKYVKAVKTPAALSKLSPTVVRSMTAGAIFGTATEASDAVTDFKNDGDQDLASRAQNIALDTAMAGAGDVTFTFAFKFVSSALKSTAGQRLTDWLKRSEVDEVPATQGKLETPVPSKVAEGTGNSNNKSMSYTLEKVDFNSTGIGGDLARRSKELRKELPKEIRKLGNFGIAEVKIDGLRSEFKSSSRVNDVVDAGDAKGYSLLKPESEWNYTPRDVNPEDIVDGAGAYPRKWDTEFKILDDITNELNKLKPEQRKGRIDLYTDREPCASCSPIIEQFKAKYPNIEVFVYFVKELKR